MSRMSEYAGGKLAKMLSVWCKQFSKRVIKKKVNWSRSRKAKEWEGKERGAKWRCRGLGEKWGQHKPSFPSAGRKPEVTSYRQIGKEVVSLERGG